MDSIFSENTEMSNVSGEYCQDEECFLWVVPGL